MRFILFTLAVGGAISALADDAAPAAKNASNSEPVPAFWSWAERPTMGWNSWDCFGTGVNEEQTLANAQYMPKRGEKNVSLIGICTFPPSPSALKERSASAASLTVSESDTPSNFGLPVQLPSEQSTVELPIRKFACITFSALPGGFMSSITQSDKLFQRYRALQQYVGWTDQDAKNVARIAPLAEVHFKSLIEDFYAAIRENPATMKVITGGAAQIERLKGTLVSWLHELFSGKYDEAYVVRRWKVGLRHVEIGLDQVYTNAALSRLRNGLLQLLLEKDLSGDVKAAFVARISLNKLLDLDLAIIEDAYQTEMQRRQQQVERLATIGQVAGGIAHELRNPLNVIKTSVYYLRNSPSLSPEKLQSHLERIDRQASVADNVIGALNSFARLPLPEMQPTRLEECLREVVELVGLPNEIQLTLDLPSTLPSALADRQQLSIVFGNLIRNARDAMPQGGALAIRGRHKAGFIEIDVEDSGMNKIAVSLTERLLDTRKQLIDMITFDQAVNLQPRPSH